MKVENRNIFFNEEGIKMNGQQIRKKKTERRISMKSDMLRQGLLITLSVAVYVFVFAGTSAFAVPFNNTTDFSTTLNPNSPWSYRSAAIGAPNSASTLLPSCCFFGGWNLPSDPFTTVGPGSMHPGISHDSVLGFDFPAAFTPGLVSLQADVVDIGGGSGDGQILSVWENDTLLQSFSLAASFPSFSIDLGIMMDLGDSVYLRLNNNGSHFFDSVGTSVTFSQATTPVPEPSTMILLGTGLIGLVGFNYKRKNQAA